MKRAYRHGDVWLLEIDKAELPIQHTVVESGMLAEGEVTGHHHRVTEGAVVMKDFDDNLYVSVQKNLATIVHQEHGDVRDAKDIYRYKEIPAGDYKVVIKREYQHGESRKVLD